MKANKITLALFALALGTTVSMAQTTEKNQLSVEKPSREDRLEEMKNELGLKEDQIAKMKSIKEKYQAENKQLHQQIKSNQDKQRKEIMEVLTPEQREKMKQMREDHKQPGQHGGKKGFKPKK